MTVPAPIEPTQLLQALDALETDDQKKVLLPKVAIEKKILEVFDTSLIKTKMEQFYTLLYVISTQTQLSGPVLSLNPKHVARILLESKVFPSGELPAQIESVKMDLKNKKKPHIFISFKNPSTVLPLNQGQGFNLYRNGLCQRAMQLEFKKSFSFWIEKNRKGRIVVSQFDGVNLVGKFGNRGIVNVDINYVSLRAVEFYKGTQNGKVTAYVADEEFKQNKHSKLLQWVSKMVPDRSVQPIDW